MSLFSSVSMLHSAERRDEGTDLLSFVVMADREGDKKAQKILNELENIDDECEEKNIDFVKTSDEGIDKEYDLSELPALAFYRHKFRTIYTGDLTKEDEILDWVLELYESNPDVIESVDRKTLQVLINDVEHLAVFFCKFFCPRLVSHGFDNDNNDLKLNSSTGWQMMKNVHHAQLFSKNLKQSTTTPTNTASNLLSQMMLNWHMKSASSRSQL